MKASPAKVNPFKALLSTVALTLLLASVPLTPAWGETLSRDTDSIVYEVPKGWKHEAKADRMQMSSADGILQVWIWMLKDIDEALDYDGMVAAVSKIVGEPEIKFPRFRPQNYNGFNGLYLEGFGELDGEPARWQLDVMMMYKERPVAIFYAWKNGATNDHGAAMTAFIASLKAAKEAPKPSTPTPD